MTTPNIKPEDVKRLIEKLNKLAEWDKKTHALESEFLGWGFGVGGACEAMRQSTQTILTLLRLLDEVGEAAHAYLSCDDADYTDINEFAQEKIRTRAELVKALTAIEPYLTTGDTNE